MGHLLLQPVPRCLLRKRMELREVTPFSMQTTLALQRRPVLRGGARAGPAQVEQPVPVCPPRTGGRGVSAAGNPVSRQLPRGGGSDGFHFPRAIGPNCVFLPRSECRCSLVVMTRGGTRFLGEKWPRPVTCASPAVGDFRLPTCHTNGVPRSAPPRLPVSTSCSALSGRSPPSHDPLNWKWSRPHQSLLFLHCPQGFPLSQPFLSRGDSPVTAPCSLEEGSGRAAGRAVHWKLPGD